MDLGIGFSETILIVLLILLLFGSKQLPKILKEAGKFIAAARIKSNELMSEIQGIQNISSDISEESKKNKNEIRAKYIKLRKDQSVAENLVKSGEIARRLLESDVWMPAKTIMIYLSTKDEVLTDFIIKSAIIDKKRVIVPYLADKNSDMAISELSDLDNNIETGPFGIRQPKKENLRRFLKSDLDLIICPGVAFDRRCARIGHGNGYYDRFLKELRGKVPIIALAFDFQIMQSPVPFSYHDVSMDMIFTESGTLTPNE